MLGNMITLEAGTIVSFKNTGNTGVLTDILDDAFVIRLDGGGQEFLSRECFIEAYRGGSITLKAKHEAIKSSSHKHPSDKFLACQAHYGKYFDAIEQTPEGSRFSKSNLQKIVNDFRNPEKGVPADYLINSYSSLRRKYKKWDESDRDFGVFIKGSRAPKKSKFSAEVLDLIEEIIYDFYLSAESPSTSEAYARLEEEYDKQKIEGKLPSRSWFYESISALNIYEVTLARKGRRAAKKLADRTKNIIHADYPLQHVEVDAVHINIGIVAEDRETYKGTLIVYFAIDRFTRCILGYETSIKTKKMGEATQSVLRLIDHIVLPKPFLSHVDNQWIQGGKFHYFINDAGLAFYNQLVSIKLMKVGPHVQVITPTGRPKRKPFIERFNRTFREQLACKLPGYLPSRAIADDYDFILKKVGLFTESEIRKIIEKFICDYYHQNPHRGLEGMTPAQAWQKSANKALQVPSNMSEFTDLVGHAQRGVIQGRNGIQTNAGLFYNNPELMSWYLELTPNISSAKNPQVHLIADPNDVSYIHVINPVTLDKISVPCTNARIAPKTSLNTWKQMKQVNKGIKTKRIKRDDPLIKPGSDRYKEKTKRNKPSRNLPAPTDVGSIISEEFESMLEQRNQALPVTSQAPHVSKSSKFISDNGEELSIDFDSIPDLEALKK
jgi:putative transposase